MARKQKYRCHLSQDCSPGPPELEHGRRCSPPRQRSACPDCGRRGSSCDLDADFLPGPQRTGHPTSASPPHSALWHTLTSRGRHLSPDPRAATGKPQPAHRVTLGGHVGMPRGPSWSGRKSSQCLNLETALLGIYLQGCPQHRQGSTHKVTRPRPVHGCSRSSS